METRTEATTHDLLTENEAAELLRCSPRTLQAWRVFGSREGRPVLPFLKLGALVRYQRRDVDRFLAQRRRTSTSEQTPATGRQRRAG